MAPTFFAFIVLLTVEICAAGAAGWEWTMGTGWQPPPDTVVPPHGHAALRCRPPGPPEVPAGTWTASWVKAGEGGAPSRSASRRTWREDGRRVITPEGDLLLHNVTRGADFRCLIQSASGGILSRLTKLQIASLSRSVTGPKGLTVSNRETARLTCHVDSIPAAEITWKRDNIPLPKDSTRYVTLPSGVLLISGVGLADQGSYRCMATNNVLKKSRHSAGALLSVAADSSTQQPPFLSGTENIKVVKGGSVVLECSAPTDVPLVWSFWRDGNCLRELNSSVSVPGVRILSLHNVQEDQAGSYNCSFSTDSSSGFQVTEVDVIVPPTVVKPPQSQIYPTARTARFSCEVHAYPSANITWYKDGNQVEADGRIKIRDLPGGNELVLSTTVATDTGLYQCIARNSGGESFGVGHLFVNSSGLQSPPSNLSCRKVGESFVVVQWEQPDRISSSDKILAYTIHHWPTDNKGEYQQNVVGNLSYNATGLDPFRNYTFYVRSYGPRQASENSEELICQTKESVPEAAPKVTLEPISTTKLLTLWSPLPENVARGHITEYKVLWRPFNGSATKVKEVSGRVLSYNITELTPGMKYEVLVLAATSKGWPSVAEDRLPWVEVVMPSTSSLPPAPSLQLAALNSTCVIVKWMASNTKTDPLIGWKIVYGKEGGSFEDPVFLPANSSHYLLTGLDPQTFYEVHVSGYTETENGDSTALKIRTSSTLSSGDSLEIEAPSGLEAEPISPYSINLTWSSPPSHLGVAYYTVAVKLARASRSSSSAKPISLNSTNHWVQIQNLQPNTVYELKVRLHDNSGRFSPFSDKIECRTFENAPGVVSDVRWEPLNASAVRVMWKEPSESVSQINVSLVPLDESDSIQLLLDGSLSSTEVVGLLTNVPYKLIVCGLTRGGMGPASPAQTVLIRTPGIIGNSAGEQYTSQSTDIPLMLCVIVFISIIIVLAITVLMWQRTCKSVQSDPGISVQANGNVLSDPETHEMEVVRCHLPAHNVESVIGSNFDYKSEDGITHSRHLVHITENPQYDTIIPCKGRPLRFSHDKIDVGQPEETFNLLPSKAISLHCDSESDFEDSGEEEVPEERSHANCDPLNVTQVTDVDFSFLNNNNKSSSCSSNSSTGALDSCGSERSNILTNQQLLVTLSTVPLRHVGPKSIIEVPEVSIISPNG